MSFPSVRHPDLKKITDGERTEKYMIYYYYEVYFSMFEKGLMHPYSGIRHVTKAAAELEIQELLLHSPVFSVEIRRKVGFCHGYK